MATNSVRNEGLSCNAAEAGKCDIRLQGWKPGAEFGKCQKKKKSNVDTWSHIHAITHAQTYEEEN